MTIATPAGTASATLQPQANTRATPLPRLIDWLYKAAARRGQTRAEMARQLGVTYGYIHQLATGIRSVENITADFARAAARYLDIPAAAVMVAAGRIRVKDFLLPEPVDQPSRQLAEGLERIAADPVIGALMPAETWTVPDSVKALLVALYEDATQQELFPPRQLPLLLRGLQDAAIVVDELEAANDASLTAAYLSSEGGRDA